MAPIKKLYYSIGEVSKICDVEPHVLRYWESIFETLKPAKNRAGKRMYNQEDLKTIMELKMLIKEEKYSTAGAKKALDTRDKGWDEASRINLSIELTRDLRELRLFLVSLLDRM
jgi:DNA-binding transcriptional MerR regulator